MPRLDHLRPKAIDLRDHKCPELCLVAERAAWISEILVELGSLTDYGLLGEWILCLASRENLLILLDFTVDLIGMLVCVGQGHFEFEL